jgi:hypothetical protein
MVSWLPITAVAAFWAPLLVSWLTPPKLPLPVQNVSRETSTFAERYRGLDQPRPVRAVPIAMTLPVLLPQEPPPPDPAVEPVAAPAPKVERVRRPSRAERRAARRERLRARHASLNVCARHGLRMKVTRRGRSWRCR